MERLPQKLLYLMIVLVPYIALVAYSITIYPDLPDKLEHDLPKVVIFVPSLVAAILPITFAGMVFLFDKYLRRGHYLAVGAFMNLGLIGLIIAVYLVKDSWT